MTLASDPERNVIYGAGVPTGEIYRYDVASGRTENLGRPTSYKEPYVYTGRVMWVGSNGRLYFSAGRADWQPSRSNIHYYDPETGFGEEAEWLLQDGRALEVGQCLETVKQCVFSDDKGHVYSHDEIQHTWSYIDKIKTELSEFIWLLGAEPEGKAVYVATSTSPQPSSGTALYEFDLTSGETHALCKLSELDPGLVGMHVHTGYNAWDNRGRFYFTSFGFSPKSIKSVYVTRIDPVRLKAALAGSPSARGR